MNKDQVTERITEILTSYAYAIRDEVFRIVPPSIHAGKLFEAYVLSLFIEHIVVKEHFIVHTRNGDQLSLRKAAGNIDRNSFAYFDVIKAGIHVAEIWTDVEFSTLSHAGLGLTGSERGFRHELDVSVIKCDVQNGDRPNHDQILVGIECKSGALKKAHIREVLGLRRELSVLTQEGNATFFRWQLAEVRAQPASLVALIAADADVQHYRRALKFFGIASHHEVVTL